MAGLSAVKTILYDTWPGPVKMDAPVPPNGFDSTTGAGNRTTTALYPVGTKMGAYQDHTTGAGGSNVANKGWYTMMYLKHYAYELTTTAGAYDVSRGAIVVMACGSDKANGEIACTKDVSSGNDVTKGGAPAGILCCSATPGDYVWVWVGGICPNYDISGFDDATFTTDGDVVVGPIAANADSSTAVFSYPVTEGTQSVLLVGYAKAADA